MQQLGRAHATGAPFSSGSAAAVGAPTITQLQPSYQAVAAADVVVVPPAPTVRRLSGGATSSSRNTAAVDVSGSTSLGDQRTGRHSGYAKPQLLEQQPLHDPQQHQPWHPQEQRRQALQQQHHHHQRDRGQQLLQHPSRAAAIAASAALMSRIKEAKTTLALADLYTSNACEADAIHICCFLGRLPHARDMEYSQWPQLSGRGLQLLEQLLGRFLSDLPRHKARQASSCLWVLGRFARSSVSSAVGRQVVRELVDLLLLRGGEALLLRGAPGQAGSSTSGGGGGGANALDAANVAWALARLSAADLRIQTRGRDGAAGSVAGGSSGSAGGGAGGGRGRLERPLIDERAWPLLEEACRAQLPRSSPREVAAVLWAFSAARRPAPRLMAEAAPHVLRMGTRIDSTHITNIAWAYATHARCFGGGAAGESAGSAGGSNGGSGGAGSGGGMGPTAAACAEGDLVPAVFESLSGAAALHAPRFRSQGIALTLWAFAAAGTRTSPAGPAALAAVAELRARKFSGQGLSMLAQAATELDLLRWCPGLLGALQREVLFKMEELMPLGVAHVLHMLAYDRQRARYRRRAAAQLPAGQQQQHLLQRRRQQEREQQQQQQQQQQRTVSPGAALSCAVPPPEEAALSAAAAAASAVAASDGLPPPSALHRQGETPCQRLFLRELSRRAELLLPDTTPRTLLSQLSSLAALGGAEPRLLRAAAAAAAAHARAGAFSAPAAAAKLLYSLALLRQPCVSLWRQLAPCLIPGNLEDGSSRSSTTSGSGSSSSGAAANGSSRTDASTAPALSAEQLAAMAWAAAASPGVAEAPELRLALARLLREAWRSGGGGGSSGGGSSGGGAALDPDRLTRLVWATAVLLDARSGRRREAGCTAAGRAGDAAAADDVAFLEVALRRALPALAAAAAGGGALRSLERRAELLHAICVWCSRQRQQQEQEEQERTGEQQQQQQQQQSSLEQQGLRLAQGLQDNLGASHLPPRALLLLLRCHAAPGPLCNPRLAGGYAHEAARRLQAFCLQCTIELLQLLSEQRGGPGAAFGPAGADLARAAAQQLFARLPTATSGQLAAAAAAGARLECGRGGGGLSRAAGKLLVSRASWEESGARDALVAAGALATLLDGDGCDDTIILIGALVSVAESRCLGGPAPLDGAAAAALRGARGPLDALLRGGGAAGRGKGLSGCLVQLRDRLREAVEAVAELDSLMSHQEQQQQQQQHWQAGLTASVPPNEVHNRSPSSSLQPPLTGAPALELSAGGQPQRPTAASALPQPAAAAAAGVLRVCGLNGSSVVNIGGAGGGFRPAAAGATS